MINDLELNIDNFQRKTKIDIDTRSEKIKTTTPKTYKTYKTIFQIIYRYYTPLNGL